ncbi:anaerobic sulfatase maturase, partial [Lacrimispora sp.]|uniref:anaerobic sulfatase maturase n=1 Tax=Lacrimispora sp. TaxID=2719234 RepID=UPI0034613B46
SLLVCALSEAKGMLKTMKNLYLMIKPVSGICNMGCKYCFYADETNKRTISNYGFMSHETLKLVIEKALKKATCHCTIAFQGGEPTLAGLPFFRQAVEYSQRFNVNNCRISFSIQTNGLVIDKEWCKFFFEHNFLVGVSLDGPKSLHDKYRVDAQGKGTYSQVFRAAQMLQQHQVDVNILTVITADTCRNFRKIYGFFERSGFEYQQYIPCLDSLEEERGQQPWSLIPKHYEEYLKTAFDCWYQEAITGHKRYHRYFDNLLLMLDRQQPESCGMQGICGMQYVAEADGSLYPCDFYMLDNYKLGNLKYDTFDEVDKKREEIQFIKESIDLHEDCVICQWKPLCYGGCRRDRDYFEHGFGKNYYCEAYKGFFLYAYSRLEHLYFKIISESRK